MKNYKDLDKRYRYSLRKFKVGVASVAVGAFFLVSANSASAAEVVAETEKDVVTTDANATTTENTTAVESTTVVATPVVNKVEEKTVTLGYTVKFVNEAGEEVYKTTKSVDVTTR